MSEALPMGVATGVGSMPGTDVHEAVNIVFGELPEWPILPELPDRGLGADMIGRGAALLEGLPVQWWAFRWELADLAGRDARRALDFLERDLDALHGVNATGPVRLTAVGPFTLAANLWRRTGGAMLADPGAVADLTASLTEGLRNHVAAAQARMPNAALSVQIDEPSLPAALAGRVNTESGLDFYRRVPPEVARERLRELTERVGVPVVVHCCAPDVPVKLLEEAGAQALSVDLTLVDLDDVPKVDALGEYLDGGGRLIAGVVPSLGQPRPGVAKEAADRVQALWHRLGFDPEQLPRQVSVSTTCGMAGASPDYARFAMEASREAAERLRG
ncbi:MULTISPECIES: methionine synthase [Glycomyces]|uniref:Methionine synthase n=2 Tax=Glycomyces TaxID=58113 RepID=A0A9X3PH25_9ACTN|nr:methionine synthase [Glycomyces lechevalierae]MDA1385225.1 methionine synthase [Glycomyces lechevalierae]MDR7337159.1 methionine synthase II (cobalamin-independent) [Glycomyces lechevalierae]